MDKCAIIRNKHVNFLHQPKCAFCLKMLDIKSSLSFCKNKFYCVTISWKVANLLLSAKIWLVTPFKHSHNWSQKPNQIFVSKRRSWIAKMVQLLHLNLEVSGSNPRWDTLSIWKRCTCNLLFNLCRGQKQKWIYKH